MNYRFPDATAQLDPSPNEPGDQICRKLPRALAAIGASLSFEQGQRLWFTPKCYTMCYVLEECESTSSSLHLIDCTTIESNMQTCVGYWLKYARKRLQCSLP